MHEKPVQPAQTGVRRTKKYPSRVEEHRTETAQLTTLVRHVFFSVRQILLHSNPFS
jgi:hypothetical protein